MIISHKHKFIFIRPHKVGGTSVHLALSFQSGEYDTVSRLHVMHSGWMDGEGCERYYIHLNSRENTVQCPHSDIMEIRKRFGIYYFNTYKKISIVRNPWDAQVSAFLYLKSQEDIKEYRKIINWDSDFCKEEFKKHMIKCLKKLDGNRIWNIDRYCFLKDEMVLDFVLRFENLENDYRKLCGSIGIKYIEIPRAKCEIRTNNRHYSEYYDEDTVEMVRNESKNMIEYFGYEFEEI